MFRVSTEVIYKPILWELSWVLWLQANFGSVLMVFTKVKS